MTKVRVKYTRTKFDSFATNFVIWIVTETPQFISINVQILHRGWDRGCAVAPAKVAPSCFLADEKKQGGGLSAWVACSHLRGPSRKSPKKKSFFFTISQTLQHFKSHKSRESGVSRGALFKFVSLSRFFSLSVSSKSYLFRFIPPLCARANPFV